REGDAGTDGPPGERRRVRSADLQDAHSKSRLRLLTVDDHALGDFDRPVRGEVEFDLPGHFSETEREGSFTDSRVWSRLLSYTLDHDRTAPLDLGTPFDSTHRYEVRLPLAYCFDGFPRDQFVHSKWGWFRLTVTPDPRNPRKIDLLFRTRLEKTRVEPADFAAFRKFHEEVSKHYRAWLTLPRTQETADILPLEVLLAWTPGDSLSAAVLARLYQQNAQPADARRILARARLCNPDDAALWELTIKSAVNVQEE